MGLPIIEWVPSGSVSIGLESGVAPAWTLTSNVSYIAIRPDYTPPFTSREVKYFLEVQMAAAGVAQIDIAIDGTHKVRQTQDWGFYSAVRSADGSTIDSISVVVRGSNSGTITTASALNVAGAWQQIQAVGRAGALDTEILLRVFVNNAASAKKAIFGPMVGGRVLDFEKRVKYDRVAARQAAVSVSGAGIAQTDLLHRRHDLVLESNDEDYELWFNAGGEPIEPGLWGHAAEGGEFGFAADRVSRGKGWFPRLVLPEESESIWTLPVGGERYRIGLQGMQQRLLDEFP